MGEKSSQLPGMGGVYNTRNLGAYSYGHQNPVLYSDPDGNFVFIPVVLGALWVADKAFAAYETYQDVQAIKSGEKTVAEVAKERASEHAAGMAFGAIGRITVKVGKRLTRADDVVDLAKQVDGPKIKPCSFSAETLVMTQDGLKPIVDIREGDIVLARDEQTGENVWRKVVGAMSKMHETVLVLDIETEAGQASQIITTEDHPFYIQGKGWAEAGTLASGALLETAEGFVKLTGKTSVAKQQLAYDLTVYGAHTFFVGEQKVLVHNCSGKLLASQLPKISRGSKEWQAAVSELANLKKGKLNFRVESASDARALLKEARGNMDRRKQYSSKTNPYRKGYETHNDQNPRELGADNDLQHLKWKDGKSGGHIYYDSPN